MSNKERIIRYLLTLPSWIYGCVTYMRNKLFDWNILKSERFDIPVISVGNITVGGTGKTPHVEYLIENLSPYYNIAVLSRGYKRKTKGFVLGTSHSTPETLGDEPYQMLLKFGKRIKVAVCESRAKGIRELQNIFPKLNLIILDDAFQHRYVDPKVSILLIDYNHPVYEDQLLPLGRLRENISALTRADYVVMTKCPSNLNPIDYRVVSNNLDLFAFQKLYFSKVAYSPLQPVFSENNHYVVNLDTLTRNDTVLLLTGIANPRGLVKYFSKFDFDLHISHYPDHHYYTRKDLIAIESHFDKLKGARKIIITTEKDAVRLANNPYFPHRLKHLLFYLPIEIDFINREDNFINDIRRSIESKTN